MTSDNLPEAKPPKIYSREEYEQILAALEKYARL